jgi:ATP-binding cassette subfamily B protein/ATP-binding cassette subfamily C protein
MKSQVAFSQYVGLLARYLKPQRVRVTLMAVCLFAGIGFQLLNPQILSEFIDTLTGEISQYDVLTIAIMYVLAAGLAQGLGVVTAYLASFVGWTATNALRADLLAHTLHLDLSFHKARTPGELIERVDGDVTLLSKFFSQLTILLLGNFLLLGGIVIALFLENVVAGIVGVIFTITATFAILKLRGLAVPYMGKWRQKTAEFYGFLGEQISGREDLKGNGARGWVMNRMYALNQGWLYSFHQMRLSSTVLWATTIAIFVFGNILALGVGAWLYFNGTITLGTVFLFYTYFSQLSRPIEQIYEQLEVLQQADAAIGRVRALFDTQSKLDDGGDTPLPTGAFSVDLETVFFRYEDDNTESVIPVTSHTPDKVAGVSEMAQHAAPLPLIVDSVGTPYMVSASPTAHAASEDDITNDWILSNLTLHLAAGETLGLLGRTGSGKTTLARLLLRLYDVQCGEVKLAGIGVKETPLAALRRKVGYVTQDVQIFQATVRDNITFFNRDIPDAKITEALEVLGLADWLHTLHDGLDTLLGSEGRGLSAGEAQLLAFARVFLKDPGLVILDEASSRLDPMTEAFIDRAVGRLMQGRTGLIIAHRLATVQRVDSILILDGGHILEYGKREALLATPTSRFARLMQVGMAEVLV